MLLQEQSLIDKQSEGISIGRKQGITIGRNRVIAEAVKNLAAKGKTVSQIADLMLDVNNISITPEEIKSILEDEKQK